MGTERLNRVAIKLPSPHTAVFWNNKPISLGLVHWGFENSWSELRQIYVLISSSNPLESAYT